MGSMNTLRATAHLLTLALVVSCTGAKPQFNAQPRVEIPIEKKPAQDPTLFKKEEPPKMTGRNIDAPDPPPLRTHDHFDVMVEFNKGEVSIVSSQAVHLAQPESTPRRVGRFAFELWSGAELVDRVRFDFPLLGAGGEKEEDALAAGLSARTSIRVPSSARASEARILDRKTRKEVPVAWPLVPTSSPESP